ncbi:MAG: 2,4-dienoyl-CoA reductase-like NADH-dependent reductase (Old Yellow Enzyme family) [Zhongshania sp.]|jgi:2,4-dienoyl-CoA reductase-like NADH-dependent reductase (Old Yellow Enzyme family)
MKSSKLFKPYTIKNLTLKNRVVTAPMTRFQSPNGVVTKDVVSYYRRRAAADVGLIITEGVGVNRPSALNDESAS